jgi:tRNA (cytidine/uridine-2'-O-)-methyltransferase
VLAANQDKLIRIPINDQIRSLNLANSVAIIVYEVLRQQRYPGLSFSEPKTLKGPNWLNED